MSHLSGDLILHFIYLLLKKHALMKSALRFFLIGFFFNIAISDIHAQNVGINNDFSTPDPSAMLDVKSTSKGMLIPRMTTGERTAISSPATGLMVYDITTKSIWYYNGTSWVNLYNILTQLADADNDTKVQVEKNPDEDIIRFDLAGQERMTLIQNANGQPRLEIGTGINLAVGKDALLSNTSGNYNTANGYKALYFNTTGGSNTANGTFALFSNTIGNNNTANGLLALYFNTEGYNNTANGNQALSYNTFGANNSANGNKALYSNTNGNNNTANGNQALFSNTIGGNNTANGNQALFNNTIGENNTANGTFALFSNTIGGNNTANGLSALYFNTEGYNNTANGNEALNQNTAGSDNTADGRWSLYYNTIGNSNTATGIAALYSNTDGDTNAAFGRDALYYNTTGNNNTAVGYGAFSIGTSYSNSTGIGHDAEPGASNSVRIGDNYVTWIGGHSAWNNTSDARVKKNITEDVKGLEFIKLLRPVIFNFDKNKIDQITGKKDSGRSDEKYEVETIKHSGFIAQEVEQASLLSGYAFSGVSKPKNDRKLYSLAYSEFVVPLVKAVQEQQAMIENQKNQLEVQQQQIDLLMRRIEALENKK